ncbi:hypothetical protein LZ32DRAFT_647039 [Colletotrichum eremochloae]|nr:hypothetical protein LZ32DRAFT_647039 [Colletotrichum eremochloae]
MAKRHCYREIRPALESTSSSVTVSGPDTGRRSPLRLPLSNLDQRRRNVLVACDSCRKQKSKCSAGQPKCSRCVAKGVECRYNADPSESRITSLKRRHDEMTHRKDSLEYFFAAMQSMPEGQAYDSLKRIRSGTSTDDIVREIEAGCLLVEFASQGDVAALEREELGGTKPFT